MQTCSIRLFFAPPAIIRALTATLAVTLTVSLAAIASAQAADSGSLPDHVRATGVSDAAQRGYGNAHGVQRKAARIDASMGISDAAQGDFGTAARVQPAVHSLAVGAQHRGLSAFMVALISVGGALTLAGVAYGGTRLAHQRAAVG
jgi:hypothetical protein